MYNKIYKSIAERIGARLGIDKRDLSWIASEDPDDKEGYGVLTWERHKILGVDHYVIILK